MTITPPFDCEIAPGAQSDQILAELGYGPDDRQVLHAAGVV